ncbi:MAG: hypothetical protein LBP96_01165 [Bacteroidales bacterium]|jgi:hypothetical protein|nr:hypothetical protein [Bacteroidales bacterium]
MKHALLSLLLIAFTFGVSAQTIIYVKPGGTGTGSSWADACDIEVATTLATSGTQIWVEGGTYFPKTMLVIPDNVEMYGGFSGLEGSLPASGSATIIDAQKKYGSVVRLGISAVLNGFTIQNGSADANDNSQRNGGGVWADDYSVIRNCIIKNNHAIANGGGVYAKEDVKIFSSTIENNTAGGKGDNVYGCCVTLDNCNCIAPLVCVHPSTSAETRTNIVELTPFKTLTVSATGTESLSYQWYSNTTKSTVGAKPVGSNSPSYTPPSIIVSQLYYFVVVTNACGTDTSNISGLHTVQPLGIDYTGAPRELVLFPGVYEIECWGAQGGDRVINAVVSGGTAKGGYSVGTISIGQPTTFFVYVGQAGARGTWNAGATVGWGGVGGWNGGADGGGDGGNSSSDDVGGGGGGGTDVRLVSGVWSDISSLRSRIIVAGGAGGGPESGWGGGLTGGYQTAGGKQATQTDGFAFGWGQVGGYGGAGYTGKGGGGGGWYGGGSRSTSGGTGDAEGGNGGSGFISGHSGCNAINQDGTHRGNPTHYSGYIFTGTRMAQGNQSMPNPRGAGNITGNTGHGFVRISRKE